MAVAPPAPDERKPWMAALPGSDPQAMAAAARLVEARLDAHAKVRRVASPKIDLFVAPGFVTAGEAAELIAMIDAHAVPSTSLREEGAASRRSSFTCRFQPDDPLIERIDARIDALLGIEHAHGELLQGQRYREGQQFGLHNDYFASGYSYSADIAGDGGQRTWTAMVYLNRPEQGGETVFPRVPVSIPPTPGVVVIWNNLADDGLGNPWSHHAGAPVAAGAKYVLTKWYREREWTPRGGAAHYRD